MKKEVMSIEDLCFPVEMVKAPYEHANSNCAMDIIAHTPEGLRRVNSCSNGYGLVPCADIFPRIEDVLRSDGIAFKATYQMQNYSNFFVSYELELPELIHEVAGNSNDIIVAKLETRHSYNGLVKYAIDFGIHRQICINGLTVPMQEATKYNLSISGKHTQSIHNSLRELHHMLQMLVRDNKQIFSNIAKVYDVMGDTFVPNVRKRIEEVAKATGIVLVENKKRNTVLDLIDRINVEKERLRVNRTTDWLVYNALNQYINDENVWSDKRPDERQKIDQRVLTYMSSSVERSVEPIEV